MVKVFGRNSLKHPSGSMSKQLLLLLVSFLTGYLSASIFDFTSASNWVNTHILAGQRIPAGQPHLAQKIQLPKPKFEFYTMLANDQAAPVGQQPTVQSQVAAIPPAMTNSGTSPAQTASPTPSAPMDLSVTKATTTVEPSLKNAVNTTPSVATDVKAVKAMYMLQVAAFKNRLDAERVKASLALKGFAVRVVAVSQPQMIWYRVLIGPFPTREEAQRAQSSVAHSTHIIGIVKKMDA